MLACEAFIHMLEKIGPVNTQGANIEDFDYA